MTSPVTEKAIKKNVWQMPESSKYLQGDLGVGQWSFIGPGSEKMWYSAENSPQGAWDHIADEMLLEFAESGHPTFRATTPIVQWRLYVKNLSFIKMDQGNLMY